MGKEQGGVSRREFLRQAATGAAITIGAASGLNLPAVHASTPQAVKPNEMKFRTLGRTKLKVSQLGFGHSLGENPAIGLRAFDMGVTYFDTAAVYRNGNCEIALGKAFKGKRDKIIIGTKWSADAATPAADLLTSLDASLKRLGTDHVDIIQLHGAATAEQVRSDEVWAAFTKARQSGKERFHGVSTHGNEVEVARAAIKSGRYDTILVPYNALLGERMAPAIKEAHEANIGVIAMKALQPVHSDTRSEAVKKLNGNVYQKAIQWVLQNQNVDVVIVDMLSFDEVQEDYHAAVTAANPAEMKDFEKAVASIALGSCHLCGACTGQCPAGVKVAEIMRYLLYHDGYGAREHAVSLYHQLPAIATAAACADCPGCRPVCPWGVQIRQRMERAHTLLT